MADAHESLERTQPASPRWLAELRARGQWPRSPALVAAAALLVGFVLLQPLAGRLGESLADLVRAGLAETTLRTEPTAAIELTLTALRHVAGPLLLILLGVAGTALLTGFGQGGAAVRLEELAPNLDRLDPRPRLARIFSFGAWGDGVWSVAKALGAFALAAAWGWAELGALVASASADPNSFAVQCGRSVALVGVKLALVVLVLGLADYAWAWWSWSVQIRMTPAEQKAEHRELQGDPVVRGRRREQMRRAAAPRMSAVEGASDLLLLGPGRIALWVRRDCDSDWRLVVKTSGPGAEPLRRAAERAGVRRIDAGLPASRLFRECRAGDCLNAAVAALMDPF